MTAVQLAEKLVKSINGKIGSGISASNEEALIMLEGNEIGVDYKIITADNMYGVNITEEEHARLARVDFNHIKDLATKAAASAGFTDTFEDSVDFYKNYPLEDSDNSTEIDYSRYSIVTLTFNEPRATKTVDQGIKQIVQLVLDFNVAGDVETALYAIMGINAYGEQEA